MRPGIGKDMGWRAAWIIVAMLLVSGCANVSRYQSGSVVAYGERLDGAAEPLYYAIRLDQDGVIDAHAGGVLLKLAAEAEPVAISALTPELVAQFLPAFEPPPQWPRHLQEKARRDDAYAGGGFHIRFSAGRLQSVGICSHCEGRIEAPVVGSRETGVLYRLPLTRQQLVDVFGEPERLDNVNEVRY